MTSDNSRRGAVIRTRRLRRIPRFVSAALFRLARIPQTSPVEHGVELYRIEYWTSGVDGRPVPASGLLAMPTGRGSNRGLVSYQHATQTDRSIVPSSPSRNEGVLISIEFAARGYVLVAPDYIGLGSSPGQHPYLHAASEAAAVVDLVRAATDVVPTRGRSLRGDLYLVGFSQGGHASLAALRALESEPIDGLSVMAAASVAGPYSLLDRSLPYALNGRSALHSPYVGYVATSYAAVTGHPLASIVRHPWPERLPGIFDGSRTLEQVAEALPNDPRQLLTTEALADLAGGRQGWFARALADNSVDDWRPMVPVRCYYGEADLDASPDDAIETARSLRERGGDAEAISVGQRDHNATAFAGIPLARDWFSELASRYAS